MFRREVKFILLMHALVLVLGLLVSLAAPNFVRVNEKNCENAKQGQLKGDSRTEVICPSAR